MFSTSLEVAISLCIIYGLWLVAVVGFYILYPAKQQPRSASSATSPSNQKMAVEEVNFEMKSRNNGSLANSANSRGPSATELAPSTSSASMRGPKPLTKSVIDEEKMIQLRKKSMDFVEAQKHMRQLNAELGIKHQLARELDEDEDEGFKVRMECKDSKTEPDSSPPASSEEDDEDSPVQLRIPSSPEVELLEDPFPSLDRKQLKLSPDIEENIPEVREDDDTFNQFHPSRMSPPLSGTTINRASTFNFGGERAAEDQDFDNTSEKGGSLRITRHSKRARVKLENVFQKSTDEGATPSFNITPSTPPLERSGFSYSPCDRQESMESTPTPSIGRDLEILGGGSSNPAPLTAPNTNTGRRRRAGMVPLSLPSQGGAATTSTDGLTISEQPLGAGCPFQSSLSARSKSPSPRPCRRGISPSGPSGSSLADGDRGASPRPKKKVSVAQIEATFVPPTPVSLEPPTHVGGGGVPRSPSFNRSRQDAFSDNAFRSITQISQDAICCANSVGDIVFWSAGASKMFGYTPGEAIGSSLEVMQHRELGVLQISAEMAVIHSLLCTCCSKWWALFGGNPAKHLECCMKY